MQIFIDYWLNVQPFHVMVFHDIFDENITHGTFC